MSEQKCETCLPIDLYNKVSNMIRAEATHKAAGLLAEEIVDLVISQVGDTWTLNNPVIYECWRKYFVSQGWKPHEKADHYIQPKEEMPLVEILCKICNRCHKNDVELSRLDCESFKDTKQAILAYHKSKLQEALLAEAGKLAVIRQSFCDTCPSQGSCPTDEKGEICCCQSESLGALDNLITDLRKMAGE